MHTGTLTILAVRKDFPEEVTFKMLRHEEKLEVIEGKGKFRQKPWLLKCKFTLFTGGDIQTEVNCHTGNTWVFVQDTYGAAHWLWKKAWPSIQRTLYLRFISS